MKYYVNLKTKKIHTEKCRYTKEYASDNEVWHKYPDIKEIKKFCKKDGRIFRYCKRCIPEEKGKEVR